MLLASRRLPAGLSSTRQDPNHITFSRMSDLNAKREFVMSLYVEYNLTSHLDLVSRARL